MPHTPQPLNPRASHSGWYPRAAVWPSRTAVMGGSILLAGIGFSVPSKPNPNSLSISSSVPRAQSYPETDVDARRPKLMIGLGIGLAGPPVLGADGGWWLLGSDGEIGHFRADDHLLWSISIGSTITGAAALDEQGILYVPTARDLVYAVEPGGQQRWRFRAAAGITGPLGWVTGQGLVFVGRDRALYWLDQRANLLLRAPLGSRVSAGPVPLGSRSVVGTETGQLVAMTRQGKRQNVELGTSISTILPTRAGLVVLAADTAFGLDADLCIRWSREHVLGLGVTSALGQAQPLGFPALLQASQRVDWLDAHGDTIASVALGSSLPSDPMPEFAATDRCAWIAFDSGVLSEACIDSGARYVPLTGSSLTRPVVDAKGARVIVGSTAGGLWSLPLVSVP